MRFRGLVAVAAAAASVLVVVVGAGGVSARTVNGGNSIASSQPLPLDQLTASGWSESDYVWSGQYGEFWWVQMNAGDRIVFDTDSTSSSCSDFDLAGIEIVAPSVTDYTLAESSPVNNLGIGAAKYESSWTAQSSGKWQFFFYGCYSTSYTVDARVQTLTATRINAPSLVRAGHPFTVVGTLTGKGTPTVGAAVQIRARGPATRLSKVAHVGAGGRFSAKFVLSRPGSYVITATFYGDNHHRPSRASSRVHVG